MAPDEYPSWTWRQHIAHWIHQIAYWVDPPEWHDLIVRDQHGDEFCSVTFEGGFCVSHPPEPYTLHIGSADRTTEL